MSNELKPCPFCGADENLVMEDIINVRCLTCHATGPMPEPVDENKAIELWDTRATPVPTSGAVEVAEAHKQIYAAVQTTLENCLPGMKEPTRQAAAVSLALKLRELFAKGVA